MEIDNAEYMINQLMNEVNKELLGNPEEATQDPDDENLYKQPIYYFNQAMYKRELILTIPNTYTHVRIYDNEKKKYLDCELIRFENSRNVLYVSVEIGGLTLKTLTLEYSILKSIDHEATVLQPQEFNQTFFRTNHYAITLKNNTLIESLTSLTTQKTIHLDQQFNFYNNTKSGIYIFKPEDHKYNINYLPTTSSIYSGSLITVIKSKSKDDISQSITIFHSGDMRISPLIETTVKPWAYTELGFSMNTTEVGPNHQFYNHDSNEWRRRYFRTINEFNETGKNIYPVIHGYAVKSEDTVFGIVNNYPTGCGYVTNDQEQIQCFLTRNTAYDDDKGLPDMLVDRKAVTFSYFLNYGSEKLFSSQFLLLSDYFNLPLTSKIEREDAFTLMNMNQAILCMFPEEQEVHNFDNKDYFYSGASFSLLKTQQFGPEIELLDMFQTHKRGVDSNFVRIRNRQQKGLFGDYILGGDISLNLRDSFIFDLEGDFKYTLSGLSSQPVHKGKYTIFTNLDRDIIKKSMKLFQAGYHYMKDDIFKFQCELNGSATLQPKEIATLKLLGSKR